ncbi:MAG: glucokinase [Candidatus Andeanibacterium colombiense]|uniref:Glucokinase n=1 Tax=Candidatus Andeanibacterium colombiense TaxID=3121345 RepID=A0AAJ6BNW2_9SPHN|nr:MAG: glucokinase [Sphingomonadaceae bacterium]
MTDLVALDIGGTHARFALASVGSDGTIELGEPETLNTSDFASLKAAWEEFERRSPKPVPKAAAIAIAGPVNGDTVRMTNNSWVIHTGRIEDQLGVDEAVVLNDFAAVAHAVARADAGQFAHLSGPDGPLPASGTISVLGPGTGLGVAHLWRDGKGAYHVQATEGGHVDFAPVDAIDDAILARLRKLHRRVSTERVVAGPGISDIYHTLAAIEGRAVHEQDDKLLWERGMSGEDDLAVTAVERFCMSLGSAAGDYALAHGAGAVVIAGGLGLRLKDTLLRSGFAARFRFKGRYEQMMAGIPVKLITHPQPGLFGAAAAFAREHIQ